jgi:hypothetical protein
MATVMAHELAESATDPVLNACQWYGADLGQENGDKCAWQWGTTYTSANGARANVRLGPRDFLLQMNWVNAGPSRGAGTAPWPTAPPRPSGTPWGCKGRRAPAHVPDGAACARLPCPRAAPRACSRPWA